MGGKPKGGDRVVGGKGNMGEGAEGGKLFGAKGQWALSYRGRKRGG